MGEIPLKSTTKIWILHLGGRGGPGRRVWWSCKEQKTFSRKQVRDVSTRYQIYSNDISVSFFRGTLAASVKS